MMKPKGNYNLIHILIVGKEATINLIEYSDSMIVREWWMEKHRTQMMFESWEVWSAVHDAEGQLKWHTRHFFCFKENKIKTHPLTPLGATGYAYLNASDEDRRKVCYTCAADLDRALMDERGEITLHLDGLISLRMNPERVIQKQASGQASPGGKISVSNWCGSLSYSVELVRVGNGGMSKIRRDIYFTDHKGRVWHGVQFGNKSELVYCKRMKEGYEIGKDKRADRRNGKEKQRRENREGEEGAR